jgi:hypothetical protein
MQHSVCGLLACSKQGKRMDTANKRQHLSHTIIITFSHTQHVKSLRVCLSVCVDCLFVCAQLFIRLSFFVFVFLADVQQQSISHSDIAFVCREREREKRKKTTPTRVWGSQVFRKELVRSLARSLSLSC